MRTLGVAVAVAVILAFFYLQESSAVPASEVQELMDLEGLVGGDTLAAALEEMPEESWEMPSSNRHKRDTLRRLKRKVIKKKGKQKPNRCRYCCNCDCGFTGCGTCCRH